MSRLRIYISLAPGGELVFVNDRPPKAADGWKEFTVDVEVPGFVGNIAQVLAPAAVEVGP